MTRSKRLLRYSKENSRRTAPLKRSREGVFYEKPSVKEEKTSGSAEKKNQGPKEVENSPRVTSRVPIRRMGRVFEGLKLALLRPPVSPRRPQFYFWDKSGNKRLLCPPIIMAGLAMTMRPRGIFGILINLYSLCFTRLSTTAGSARVDISPRSWTVA